MHIYAQRKYKTKQRGSKLNSYYNREKVSLESDIRGGEEKRN
jgi:hypothetical protein